MGKRERTKGVAGEREVADTWRRHGLAVRGLEATGDHLVVGDRIVLHCESKRQETARPWAWWEQASSEAPAGVVPVVAFRRNRSEWLAIVRLEDLAAIVSRASG